MMASPEETESFFVRDDEGRPYRCLLERLTPAEARWMVTDVGGVTQVGPAAIPGESKAAVRERIVEWLRARKALGHWKSAPQ
jgi:hypothetical protein